MNGSRRFTMYSALLITENTLQEIEPFILKEMPTIQYTLYCAGNVTLSPQSLNDVLTYENAGFQRILGIKIEAKNPNITDRRLEIELGRPIFGLYANAASSLSFDDSSWAYGFHTELHRRLLAYRPWYWPLTLLGFKVVLPLLLVLMPFAATLFLFTMELMGKYTPQPYIPPNPHFENLYVLSMFVAFGVGFFMDIVKESFFPKVFFCIGRQKESFRRKQGLLYFFFVVIALGIVINLISSVLSRTI